MTTQNKVLCRWKWTALHHAAWHSHTDVVKLLLSHGAAVDATDRAVGPQHYPFDFALLIVSIRTVMRADRSMSGQASIASGSFI